MRRTRRANARTSVAGILISAGVCCALILMSLSYVHDWHITTRSPACKSSLKQLGASMTIYASRSAPAADSIPVPDFAAPGAGPVPTTAQKKAVDAKPDTDAEK